MTNFQQFMDVNATTKHGYFLKLIKMELKKAIGVLETHNRWRRGEDVEPKLKPSDIGIAIDTVVEYIKNNGVLFDVSQQREPLLAYHRYLTEELSLDLHEIWVDEHLKANNCG